MSVFDHAAATYLDTELWLRLEPLLVRELGRATEAIVDVDLPDYPTYRAKVGYLRGLQWVWKQAADLTRIERHNNEDDE